MLKLDTALAENSLTTMDLGNGDTGVTNEPQFDNGIQVEWFNKTLSESSSCLQAQATDHSFFIQQRGHSRTTWTAYHARRSKTNPDVTSVGCMPIIQAPAHELDTLSK